MSPSLTPVEGRQPPAQAQLYGDCIAQSVAAKTFDREGLLLRYRCDGPPADAFFNGLGPYAAQIGSEVIDEGMTYRFTQRIERNLTGLDYCVANSAGEHRCTVVLNVGEFLAWTAPSPAPR